MTTNLMNFEIDLDEIIPEIPIKEEKKFLNKVKF